MDKFNIIRHRGAPQETTTLKGRKIERQAKIFVLEYSAFVACAPYDDHFVYENNEVGQSAYMCTCGSPAVIVPPGPRGMFVCLFHANNGFHTTSVVNKKDFEKRAGETIVIDPKGKRWV